MSKYFLLHPFIPKLSNYYVTGLCRAHTHEPDTPAGCWAAEVKSRESPVEGRRGWGRTGLHPRALRLTLATVPSLWGVLPAHPTLVGARDPTASTMDRPRFHGARVLSGDEDNQAKLVRTPKGRF